MDSIGEYASQYQPVIRGRHARDFQLHHVCGRSYVQDKTPIGHYFIIPLPLELHDVNSNCLENVTFFPKRFTAKYGHQREIFAQMVIEMKKKDFDIPPTDVLEAIQTTKF